METEFSPDPTIPVRRDEQPNFQKNIMESAHKMPVVNKQLITNHRLDPITNQPVPHPDNESTA